MDVKLEMDDPDDVGAGGVGLLSVSSEMDLEVPGVHHIGMSREGDEVDRNQACLVVLSVEDVEAGHNVMSKSIGLGDSPVDSISGSTNLLGLTDEQQQDPDTPYDPVTQSWFTTKYSKDSLSEQGHKWKQGMWSRDEIDLLERNIEEYLRDNKLSDASEVIFNNSKDNRKNFYRIIAQGLQRPLFAVYRRVIRMYDHKNHVGRYTAEDIKKLKELRARHGNDWALIGAELGRSASSVKDKFRLLKDSCNRGKWSVDEENVLTETVFTLSGTQPGDSVTTGISWSQVADRVGTRTEKQCRAKWLNYLNWKQTGGAEWSRIDDLTLINRIGETNVMIESDLDWDSLAKNWKSVRSPQWLRSKWWSLKRQVPGYELMPLKALLEHLKLMHSRKRLREERSVVPAISKASSQDLTQTQSSQLTNGILTVQVPIHLTTPASGNLETTDSSGLQSLILPQSALASLSPGGAFLTGQGITTLHEDNHIIIQVTTVPGSEGDTTGAEGNARQIIITARQPRQTVPSLGHDETDICAGLHQANSELSSEEASAIVHSSNDLRTGNHHMTSGIVQSQVSVVEEQPISSQAQLIGTDAVLPQQNVSSVDMVGGGEAEATLVVVNTAPSSEELSQPTTGTVEDSQLGGGVFTLSGPLPALQTQGDEHNLMGSPGHLEAPHHHDDEDDEDRREEDVEEDKHQMSAVHVRRRKRSRRL